MSSMKVGNDQSSGSRLSERIHSKEAKIGVMGLGYAGLPLALVLLQGGYWVTGLDRDASKIRRLQAEESYIGDVPSSELAPFLRSGRFVPSDDFSVLMELDAVCICVPSPLTPSLEPDLSFIQEAVRQIKNYMHKEFLIILESTSYPGTTTELIGNELSQLGYQVGVDYFLCFSPERIDPGNQQYTLLNIPKVIGGATSRCTELGILLYSGAIRQIVSVSSPEVAEMSKLLENIFRGINIAFMNEMAMLCDQLGIDIWEVMDAAATKPFGFMRFQPGPGIGGHCLPLNMRYLSWHARQRQGPSRLIELAQEINDQMPHYVVRKVRELLSRVNKDIRASSILLLGIAYKPDVDDLRGSPSLVVYQLLKEQGAILAYHDPYIATIKDANGQLAVSIELNHEELINYDAIVILTNHSGYSMHDIVAHANLILDTRDACRGIISEKIMKLGAPMRWRAINGDSIGY